MNLRKKMFAITTLCTGLLLKVRTSVLVYAKSTIEDFTKESNTIQYLGKIDEVGTKAIGDSYLIVRNVGLGCMLIGILMAALSLFFCRSAQKREEKKTTFIVCVAAAVLFFAVGAVITIASSISSKIKV